MGHHRRIVLRYNAAILMALRLCDRIPPFVVDRQAHCLQFELLGVIIRHVLINTDKVFGDGRGQ